jgi:chorismate mutase/prephenate dehydratase
MRISKNYQEKLLGKVKVAYSGTEGAFGYVAAKKLYPNAQYIAYPHFAGAYNAVEEGEADCAVLPIENSVAGDVGSVMDLTFSGNLYINRVIDLNVNHCLLGVKGATKQDVKRVVSHVQALEQCDKYIKENGFLTTDYVNTALAAKYVLEQNNVSLGAIASKESAESLGLTILEQNVNNDKNNTTRFAVFSRAQEVPSKEAKNDNEHFIITFTTKNQAGTLATALNIIGAHNFNMRNLRSRPLKDLMWNYYFFIEADGNVNSYEGQNMLTELSAVCAKLKLVGTYK